MDSVCSDDVGSSDDVWVGVVLVWVLWIVMVMVNGEFTE